MWELVAVAVIFAAVSYLNHYHSVRVIADVKKSEEKFVIDLLDRFLARKIEDVQMMKALQAGALIGNLDDDIGIEPEGDPAMHGHTPEEVRAVLTETQQEIDRATEAKER